MKKYRAGENLKQGEECIILDNVVHRVESERIYPCVDCGKLRTKEEGGTTFTVCDECWDKAYPKPKRECPHHFVWQGYSGDWYCRNCGELIKHLPKREYCECNTSSTIYQTNYGAKCMRCHKLIKLLEPIKPQTELPEKTEIEKTVQRYKMFLEMLEKGDL